MGFYLQLIAYGLQLITEVEEGAVLDDSTSVNKAIVL